MRTKAAWVMEADGWEVLRGSGGSDHRKLVEDRGRPAYHGAAKVYVRLFTRPDGRVVARNSSGYMRMHDSLEEAKKKAR
jgi:hypothetical protein